MRTFDGRTDEADYIGPKAGPKTDETAKSFILIFGVWEVLGAHTPPTSGGYSLLGYRRKSGRWGVGVCTPHYPPSRENPASDAVHLELSKYAINST